MQAVDRFVDEIEKLLNSNLLSSGRIIREFLIFVSRDEVCKEILLASSAKFKYGEEYTRVFTDKIGLPKSNSKIVAFVTVTLFLIDTGKLSLSDLLTQTYPELNSDKAYNKFLSDIIMPYADSFVKLIVGEPVEEFTEPKQEIYDKMNEDVNAVIKEMIGIINALSLPQNGSENIIEALNGLSYTLPFNDVILTRNAYRGYLNALKLFNVRTGLEEDMSRILRLYGVL